MRVNVETRGITRAKRLAKWLRISHAEALGRLVLLWSSSQDEEAIEADPTDICFWFDPENDLDEKDIMESLALTGFIKRSNSGSDMFEVSGNQRHVEKLRKLRELAKKGGEANKRRIESQTATPEAIQTASRIEADRQAESKPHAKPKPMQCNSMQFKPGGLRDAIEVWIGTLEHFSVRRKLRVGEDLEIQRALNKHGDEEVSLALLGARHEEGNDGFNPARHLSLNRIFRPGNFDKLVNLGYMARDGMLKTKAEEDSELDQLFAEGEKKRNEST